MTATTYELVHREVLLPQPRVLTDAPTPAVVTAVAPERPLSAVHVTLILLGLTIFGGVLRFYHLTFPALWSDEALVYWRACGTYRDMLAPLQTDGFPPLHYSLYWLIGHYTKLTPFVMRLVPAVSGTLTIPAMYFLARQMLPKKTSLLAAAFTACSAFMLFYSRDAKMYPDTWLMVTLNLGCLLWWLRTGHSTAWLGWIAAGCLMLGLHLSTIAIAAVSPVFLLTQPRLHWNKALLLVLGLTFIASGPIGYFTKFNHWTENIDEQGWGTSGIGWVSWFNGERDGPEHARYAASSFLAGWEWPRDDYLLDLPTKLNHIDPPLYTGPRNVAVELFVLLGIAALPWPLIWRPKRELDPPPVPQWRVLFWICILTLVPGYGYYCHSVQGFYSPLRWVFEARQWLSPTQWLMLALVGVAFVVGMTVSGLDRRLLLRLLQWTLAAAAVLGICQIIFYICYGLAAAAEYERHPWGTVWTPRYLGVLWPGTCLACAALLMRLPTRAVRVGVISFFLGINVAMASLRMLLATQAPLDKIADDLYAAQPDHAAVRTYYHQYTTDMAVGGESLYTDPGKYYLQMLGNKTPMSPWLFKNSLSKYRLWLDLDNAGIAKDVNSNPQLQRVVTWTQIEPRIVNQTDRLSPLMPGWKLNDETWYPVRIIWDWRLRWFFVRREFVKTAK